MELTFGIFSGFFDIGCSNDAFFMPGGLKTDFRFGIFPVSDFDILFCKMVSLF